MTDISDLKETFRALVNDIKHMKCLYEGETDETPESTRRLELLSGAIVVESDTLDGADIVHGRMIEFIKTTDRLFSIVTEQRNIDMSHADFFKYYTKAFSKKDGKKLDGVSFSEAVWFLVPDSSALKDVNFGKICRCQTNTKGRTTNAKKLQNYLYMLYFQTVQLIHPNILVSNDSVDSLTAKHYSLIEKHIEASLNDSDNDLSSDCEINEELTDGIKTMCNSMVDQLIPDDGMKDIFKTMMDNDHMNNVLGNLLNATCKPSDIKKLKEELKNTNDEDMKQVCEETKKTLSSLDMNLDSFGDPTKFKDMQQKMEQRMKGMGGGDIGEQMGKILGGKDGSPGGDMSKMMEQMGNMMNGGGESGSNDMSKMMEQMGSMMKGGDESGSNDMSKMIEQVGSMMKGAEKSDTIDMNEVAKLEKMKESVAESTENILDDALNDVFAEQSK